MVASAVVDTNNLILLGVFALGVWCTFYMGRRGITGLRNKAMVADQQGNMVTGKDAVSLARVYLFFAALCAVETVFFLILLIIRLV